MIRGIRWLRIMGEQEHWLGRIEFEAMLDFVDD